MIVIVGIGQSLRGDDAVGLTAVQLWKDTHPATAKKVRVELAENPGVSILGLLENADTAILVDAVNSGSLQGIIHILKEEELATFVDGSDSAHGRGVAETLVLGRKVDTESMPDEIILIGIEIGQTKFGEGLSPEVLDVIPDAVHAIQKTLLKLME
jgi:hydrogenase maturation protease